MAQLGATITAAATEREIAGRGAGVFLLHAVRPTEASCVRSGAQKNKTSHFFFLLLRCVAPPLDHRWDNSSLPEPDGDGRLV